MFRAIRKHFTRKRRERQTYSVAAHMAYLEALHRRRFPDTDKDRFMSLWCEIAEICRLSPDALHEDLKIASLRSVSTSWLSSDNRLENLNHLVLIESRDLPPPRPKPATIGGVLDYLLQARQDEEIAVAD
jgi:hypothetical protein